MKIKNVKNDVKNLLINKHHLRDDDRKLIASIWYKEINTLNISAIDFLHLFADNKITHPESIRRCRAKLQELHPELRGKNYHKRKGTSVKFVNEQLRNF
tara:strand:- start:63 stop:359 length:297 start_codon:yes stop_codon:yes gene_type:complete